MCFIVPQHVFSNLVDHGNEEQKSFAAEVLEAIKSFTTDRQNFLDGLIHGIAGEKEANIAVNRSIHDAKNRMTLPGTIVRKEGQDSNKDVSVDECYYGLGKTHEFYQRFFERNSFDDKGAELLGTVHYGKNFGNAFWNGKNLVFGDGDGKIFNRFTAVIDVLGHELSHGVVEHTAGLRYYKQSGALNEHYADVFGILVKQYDRNHKAEESDWLIGEGLFSDNIEARGLRDMLHPGEAYDDEKIGKDPQPKDMSGYKDIEHDAGGVHIFSGIFNRIFANTSINLGGYGWENGAAKIWYHALTTKLRSDSDFNFAANALVASAGELYGKNSKHQKIVLDACKLVGLKPKA